MNAHTHIYIIIYICIYIYIYAYTFTYIYTIISMKCPSHMCFVIFCVFEGGGFKRRCTDLQGKSIY